MVVLFWILLCLFVSFPASFVGAHAKKQGEDLADNDGDEDEGIIFGDEGSCMSLSNINELMYLFILFSTFWMQPLSFLQYPMPWPRESSEWMWMNECECECVSDTKWILYWFLALPLESC